MIGSFLQDEAECTWPLILSRVDINKHEWPAKGQNSGVFNLTGSGETNISTWNLKNDTNSSKDAKVGLKRLSKSSRDEGNTPGVTYQGKYKKKKQLLDFKISDVIFFGN